MEAKFIRGNPLFCRYKPGSAVAAGEVLVIGDLLAIAHSAIAANTWGNVAVGGGVYEVTAEVALAVGVKCYWDNTANKVDATNTNKRFGFVAPHLASTGDGDVINCIHMPQPNDA